MFEGAFHRPYVLAAVLVLVLAEYVWRRHISTRGYDVRAALGSFGVMVVGALVKPLGAVLIAGGLGLAAQVALWQFSVADWRVWAAGFVAVEFAYYWFHRFSHTVRWFWAHHAVHHSAIQFTLPAALRLGWFGAIGGAWLMFVPLVLIGFPPLVVGALLSANLLYQFLLHTEVVGQLGPLEWVLNTPSHHRAHHSRDEAFLDCNFGGVVIVFDRLFGTFRQEPAEGGLTFGLVHPLDTNNPFRLGLAEPLRLVRDLWLAPDWKSRLRIAAGPPGRPLADPVVSPLP